MPGVSSNKRLIRFPDPAQAEPDGLVAIGGDLTPERILSAYRQGIFPWYNTGQPILWWSPDPRMVLYPQEFQPRRSLRKALKNSSLSIRFDTAFERVIQACAETPRPNQTGTWITPEMLTAYSALHHQGIAHSVETWDGDTLVGGLYGIALGRIFFGESMFAHQTDASKIAFSHLVHFLKQHKALLLDCQFHTDHLASLGARLVPRSEFLAQLKKGLRKSTSALPSGNWHHFSSVPYSTACLNKVAP